MKKIIPIIVIFSLLFTFGSCSATEAKIGSFDAPITVGDYELTVSKDIVVADELNGDYDYNEFLTTDLTVGEAVETANAGYTLAAVTYEVKNISEESSVVSLVPKLVYNTDYTYDVIGKYHCNYFGSDKNSTLVWKQDDFKLSPLSSSTCKVLFAVPKEVFENKEAPLKLVFDNCEYTVR